MAQDHRLQLQRFELKYLIPEEITSGLRDFVSCHLEPDEFGVGKPDFSYDVHSVYLDSADLKTHHAAVNGTKNRFKLRLRFYNVDPESPVFCEVKARTDNCILKQRCGLRREAVSTLLAGHLPEECQMTSREPRHFAALQRFNFLQLQMNAQPRLHNRYRREAWVQPSDNSVRVTYDRNIRCEPYFGNTVPTELKAPTQVFANLVVLELKFTDRFPNWFSEMVRCFNLMQFSSAKYSEGVNQLCEERLRGEEQFVWMRPAQARTKVNLDRSAPVLTEV